MGIHELIQNTQLKSVTMWRWGDIAKKGPWAAVWTNALPQNTALEKH